MSDLDKARDDLLEAMAEAIRGMDRHGPEYVDKMALVEAKSVFQEARKAEEVRATQQTWCARYGGSMECGACEHWGDDTHCYHPESERGEK